MDKQAVGHPLSSDRTHRKVSTLTVQFTTPASAGTRKMMNPGQPDDVVADHHRYHPRRARAEVADWRDRWAHALLETVEL